MTYRAVMWKYPLPDKPGKFTLELPVFAMPKHFGEQDRQLTLWTLVDTASGDETRSRKFLLTWTGVPDIPGGAMHVGTCVSSTGLVWHLFELETRG